MADRKTVLAVLACTAVVAVVSMRVWAHLNVPGEPHVPRYALQDFRDGVYYPAAAFLDGVDPYDQPRYTAAYPVAEGLALYSPLTLLLHAPLTWLPYRVAEAVYYFGALVLTVALGALALALCGVPLTLARVAGFGAVLLLGRPGHWNLFNGQVTLQVVLPMLVALWYARDRPLLAGVALAITTFKPTYGLPLAALLAVRGAWRAVLVGGLAAGTLTGLVLVRLVMLEHGVAPFAATIAATYTTYGGVQRKQPHHSPFRVDVVALAGRALGRAPRIPETVALTSGVLGITALALWRRRDDDVADRDARVHATSIACFGILACGYHQQYDLLALALPTAALWWGVDTWPWRDRPALRRVGLALVGLPLVNYLGTYTGGDSLGLSHAALLAASSLDNLALLALLGLFVATGWHRDRRARGGVMSRSSDSGYEVAS